MWLPLAISDLVGIVADFCGIKARRDEWLDSWCLPELAAAVRHDIEEREEQTTVAQFERLAKMFGEKKD